MGIAVVGAVLAVIAGLIWLGQRAPSTSPDRVPELQAALQAIHFKRLDATCWTRHLENRSSQLFMPPSPGDTPRYFSVWVHERHGAAQRPDVHLRVRAWPLGGPQRFGRPVANLLLPDDAVLGLSVEAGREEAEGETIIWAPAEEASRAWVCQLLDPHVEALRSLPRGELVVEVQPPTTYKLEINWCEPDGPPGKFLEAAVNLLDAVDRKLM